jgi:hypothetical protein
MFRFRLLSLFMFICGTLSSYATGHPFVKKSMCPRAPQESSIQDIQGYLKSNNIILKTEVEYRYLAQFLNEFQKFPSELKEKMDSTGAVIHLIQGNGISDDPSWKGGNSTFDGRTWANVPGAGGMPWLKHLAPTRIVINHLYTNHGSSNLFLHEHGHSLDNIIKGKEISSSDEWKSMAIKRSTQSFLKVICGSYCMDHLREGFAELFAYYNACEDTRRDINEHLPEIGSFFDQLAHKNY